ncbi:MAG: hypothetical protein GY861_09345 [bacterium]|nr:hypothetical protein [bacterium]
MTEIKLRISDEQMQNLEFISRFYSQSWKRWLCAKMAKVIADERKTIELDIEYMFISNEISEKKYRDLLGIKPSSVLALKKFSAFDGARNAIRDALVSVSRDEKEKRGLKAKKKK